MKKILGMPGEPLEPSGTSGDPGGTPLGPPGDAPRPWGTPLRPPGTRTPPGSPGIPMDHNNKIISAILKRQKRSIAASEHACCNVSP